MENYEKLIEDVFSQNYAISTDLFSNKLLAELKNDLLIKYDKGILKSAGIGSKFDFQKNLKVRGDKIHWLSKSDSIFQKEYLDKIDDFINYMNSTCFTNLNQYEFHYALYKPGTFYKKHKDQFKKDRGRIFSLVTYLNENWQKEDSGELVIYLDNEKQEKINPAFGTTVFFKSDTIEHEVLKTNKDRLSIAGWLKSV